MAGKKQERAFAVRNLLCTETLYLTGEEDEEPGVGLGCGQPVSWRRV